MFEQVSAVFLQGKGARRGKRCLEGQFCLQLLVPQITPRAGVGSASLVTGGTPECGLLCQDFPHWSTRTHLIPTPWDQMSPVPPLLTLPRNSHVQPVKHPWCAQAGERKNVLSFPRAGTWENTPEIFPIPGQGRDKRGAKSFFHFIFHHPQLSRDRTSPWHGPLPWAKPD